MEIFTHVRLLSHAGFLLALKRDRHSLRIEHAEAFVDAWSHHDPQATGSMPVRDLVRLLRELPPPLGLDPNDYPQHFIRAADYMRYATSMHYFAGRLLAMATRQTRCVP